MFIVTAFFQGTLLVMAVYFEYFGPERKEARLRDADGQLGAAAVDGGQEETENQNEPDGQPSEDTPLLQRQ